MALGFSTVGESELDEPSYGYEGLDSLSNRNPMNVYGIPRGHPHYGLIHRGMTTPPGPSYATVDITGKPPGMREPLGRNYYGPLYDPIDHATTAYSPPSPATAGRSYWDYDEPQGGGELLPWEALDKQMQGDYWMGGYGYNPLPKRRSLPYMDAFTNAFVTWPKGEGAEFQRRMWESDA
jgi:hypothetical protein